MEQWLIAVVNMSITASYVILAVLLLRLCLRRAPKRYTCLLWLAPAFRLVCPVSFPSVYSLLQVLDLSGHLHRFQIQIPSGLSLGVELDAVYLDLLISVFRAILSDFFPRGNLTLRAIKSRS